VELILTGHDLKYEAEQIVLLFFPNHENLVLNSTMSTSSENLVVTTEISFNDNKASHTEIKNIQNPTKKQLGNLVKVSAYKAAKQISSLPSPWGILTGIRPAKQVMQMLEMGISEDIIRDTFINEYLLSEAKFNLALSVAKNELKVLNKNDEKTLSLYIGIPFCPTRCLYCSFISSTVNKIKNTAYNYTKMLVSEIQRTAEILRDLGLFVETIYIGGGTPTSLDAPVLSTLLDAITSNFDFRNIIEFTAEAGRPDTITREKLEIIKNSPVNRISINPQTMHDETLKIIGRNHTVEDFKSAFYLARELGFSNINSDLIAGLPGEDEKMFSKTLNDIKELSPEGLTVHTLYIKRASFLKSLNIELATPDTVSKMINSSVNFANENNYTPYYMYRQKTTLGNLENVGFAKQGKECIYNIRTMADTQTIIALGAGAVTKIVKNDKIERIFNYKNADDYINGFNEIINRKNKIYDYMG